MSFDKTSLWRRGLEPKKKYEFAQEQERLRSAFNQARKNTSELLQHIPEDCENLTIHDITHIDALWDIADQIAGEAFHLNPAETFVFGMALLIHDAGLAAVSVEGGTNAIYSSSEFQDIEASLSSLSEPSHRRAAALFTYLREHHAKIASTLLTRTWKNPVNQQDIFLLEDAGLRSAYGETIGRIAESHHWPPSDLTAKLRSVVGAAPDLPNEWQLNDVKIALLLRCADAAHIDGRRAPLFQYALRQPKGLSDNHWRFQNKLNRPAVHDDALVYSSGSAFSVTSRDVV